MNRTRKVVFGSQKRVWVGRLQEHFGVSELRACKVMSISRSSLTYVAKARD